MDKQNEATMEHIRKVRELMQIIILELMQRGIHHDASKLESLESDAFEKNADKLKQLTYGSPEYKEALKDLGPALKHHYENNSHHPEHFSNGLNGMTLIDLVEMFVDHKASTLRMSDGSLDRSIQINKERFKMGDQLVDIFENTRKALKW